MARWKEAVAHIGKILNSCESAFQKPQAKDLLKEIRELSWQLTWTKEALAQTRKTMNKLPKGADPELVRQNFEELVERKAFWLKEINQRRQKLLKLVNSDHPKNKALTVHLNSP